MRRLGECDGVEGEELQLDPSELDTSKYCPMFGPRMTNLDEPDWRGGLPSYYTQSHTTRMYVSRKAGLAENLHLAVGH